MAVEYNTKVFVFMNNFNVSIGSWKVQRLSRRRWADEHCFGLRDVGPQLPSFIMLQYAGFMPMMVIRHAAVQYNGRVNSVQTALGGLCSVNC